MNMATFCNDTHAEVLKFLKDSGCFWMWESGHKHVAQLKSGRLSNYYVDCSPIFSNLELQDRAAKAIVHLSRLDECLLSGNDWIIAASYGATGLAQSLARTMRVKAAYMEPDTDLGLRRFDLGSDAKIWLCDDVVTTCGTLFQARDAILDRFPDAEIRKPILTYVDRRELDRLSEDKKKLRVIPLIRTQVRSWFNQQSLPLYMSKCVPIIPHGNWRELNERIPNETS